MTSRHSVPPRGQSATRSMLSQGRFGRMFRNLPPAQFGATEHETIANLSTLANAMTAKFDPPKDGPDAEESAIPALYTYFGQFVDHDITFDPVSVLTRAQDPDGLVDFRTPAFDLDNVYGRGPGDQPYMYDGLKFRLGELLKGKGVPDTRDLPRFEGRALIGDPRNDENSIVSQLQVLFLKFHNRIVDDNPDLSFEACQELVRFHYQYIVLHDFLPRIVMPSVLTDLRDDQKRYDRSKLKFFHWKNFPFMPVEFSVACYRLGHSMIRPGYRLNDDKDMLLPIFPDKGFKNALTGFQTMASGRAIDWGRFIDLDIRDYGKEDDGANPANLKRLQLAYRIDASLVDPLHKLPDTIAGDPVKSLPLRNLERGWRLGLPSGQSVARAMNIEPLKDSHILIGKAVDKPDKGEKPVAISTISSVFKNNCPLWTYILAEAAHHKASVKIPVKGGPSSITTPQLGPVGGRIVAEVILGLAFGDNSSVLSLDPQWTPVTGKNFRLKDFVAYALGHGPALHRYLHDGE